MQTYEHNGITITFDPQKARFWFNTETRRVSSSSLDGIKKQIDKLTEVQFKPFKALDFRLPHMGEKSPSGLPEVMVTAIRKPRGRRGWNNRDTFTVTNGNIAQDRYQVIPDTPQAREALQTWITATLHMHAENKRLSAIVEAARQAIPLLTPEQFNKEGRGQVT